MFCVIDKILENDYFVFAFTMYCENTDDVKLILGRFYRFQIIFVDLGYLFRQKCQECVELQTKILDFGNIMSD